MTNTTKSIATWPTIKNAKPAPAPVYRWDDHMQAWVPNIPTKSVLQSIGLRRRTL